MNKEPEDQLIKRYLANECAQEERDLLESWYIKTAQDARDIAETPNYFAVQTEILAKLKARQGRNRIVLWQKIAATAAVLLLFALGILLYAKHINNFGSKKEKIDIAEKISPGLNKAYLTLADGKRIALTDDIQGELAAQAGVKITKTRDGQLIYTSTTAINNSAQNSLINKIEAPVGGQYQLILPDGTKIWLNSSTSLKYPVSFSGLKERKVELNGEAYFEVAPSSQQPFSVVTDKQTIEVLGTHFNVNCYTDEPSVKTSLLEGSIKIFGRGTNQAKLLKPGQQALLIGEDLKISTEDVQLAVAWKNGDFVFNGENLQSLMREIARWYNVEIVYEDEFSNTTGFIGSISRKKKITEILNAIELNYNIKFKIEGRRVILCHKI